MATQPRPIADFFADMDQRHIHVMRFSTDAAESWEGCKVKLASFLPRAAGDPIELARDDATGKICSAQTSRFTLEFSTAHGRRRFNSEEAERQNSGPEVQNVMLLSPGGEVDLGGQFGRAYDIGTIHALNVSRIHEILAGVDAVGTIGSSVLTFDGLS